MLKSEKKASMKHLSWLLMGFGQSKFCYEVVVYICSMKILVQHNAVQVISLGLEGLGKGLREQRSRLWRYNIKADI